MKNSRITFIGCGNMGRSLIGGLIANGLSVNSITGTDVNAEQRQTTASQFNIEVLEDNQQAIKDADVVVLAVKPQSMQETLQAIKADLVQEKPLLISIAAGIQLSDLGKWAGDELAIVRTMPNTPALIQSVQLLRSSGGRNPRYGIFAPVPPTSVWVSMSLCHR